jgi:enoyl-CoA hydratase/carnithine racemase
MKEFQGDTLSWTTAGGVIEVALHREPCNEIGSATLPELERLGVMLASLDETACVLIIYSTIPSGFCAGADLRELYVRMQRLSAKQRLDGVRDFLERIHRVMNAIDAAPLTTIAAAHGVTFGGGLELALTCDIIIADKMARFCFPELRLGLIPGFGGIPRLKRDLGNAVVRDLVLTGRSFNATKAQSVGMVSQVTAEGQALAVARTTAEQLVKFDRNTAIAAKKFIKRVPEAELRREIETFCELFVRPEVEAGLRKFVESTDALPYLP